MLITCYIWRLIQKKIFFDINNILSNYVLHSCVPIYGISILQYIIINVQMFTCNFVCLVKCIYLDIMYIRIWYVNNKYVTHILCKLTSDSPIKSGMHCIDTSKMGVFYRRFLYLSVFDLKCTIVMHTQLSLTSLYIFTDCKTTFVYSINLFMEVMELWFPGSPGLSVMIRWIQYVEGGFKHLEST